MNKFYLFLALCISVYACQKESFDKEEALTNTAPSFKEHNYLPEETPELQDTVPLSPKSIFKTTRKLEEELGEEFRWKMVDDFTFWSAVKAGETSLISIGFEKDTPVFDDSNSPVKDQVLQFLIEELEKKNPGKKYEVSDLNPRHFKFIDAVMVEIDDYEILGKLRRLETIRYVEPESFDIDQFILNEINNKSSFLCLFGSPVTSSHISRKYAFNLNSRIPWQYEANKVYGAWDHSKKGDGVTIALIDTGISANQTRLGSQFATGESSNRFISRRAYMAGGWDDECGHGTTMAGQIAAPLNGQGAIIGAAYKANLISYRVANDVFLNKSWERQNVVDAIENVVEEGIAKIMAMAMGRFTYSGILKDASNLASDNDILFICAAGSFAGIDLYPAKHGSNVAVTVVKDDADGLNLSTFNGNAKGDFVDFCVYMKRNVSSPLEEFGGGMGMSGSALIEAKGSSAGVATVSGIAAMILSNGPWYNKWHIIDKMKHSASIFKQQNTRDDKFGWGVIDAESAVRSVNPWFYACDVAGPSSPATGSIINYDFNKSGPLSWFVRNRIDGFQWTNQAAGHIKFLTNGEFEICCGNNHCTDCVMVNAGSNNSNTNTNTCTVSGPTSVPPGYTADYNFNLSGSVNWYVNSSSGAYQWINQSLGQIRFYSTGTYTVCAQQGNCSDCITVSIDHL